MIAAIAVCWNFVLLSQLKPIKFFEVTSNNSSRNTVKYILKPADIILDYTECAFQTILMLKSSFAAVTVILHVSSCKYNVTAAYVLRRIWHLRIRSSRPHVSVQHAWHLHEASSHVSWHWWTELLTAWAISDVTTYTPHNGKRHQQHSKTTILIILKLSRRAESFH